LADHAQDVAGGSLLLERLGQIAVALLKLVEQSRVLDSDDGLVSEGLEHRDLAVGKRVHLFLPQSDNSDGFAFPKHGTARKVRWP